jgi:osmotically inducible protein OsmC
MQRKATAIWQGGLKDGKGVLSTDSKVLNQTEYSFNARFENGKGTNPEELLAAAHAGCFAMALSNELGTLGIKPKSLKATANVFLEEGSNGFAVTKSHIDLIADIPGVDKTKFEKAVKAAEVGCPVSKLFKAEITVSAKLESNS